MKATIQIEIDSAEVVLFQDEIDGLLEEIRSSILLIPGVRSVDVELEVIDP